MIYFLDILTIKAVSEAMCYNCLSFLLVNFRIIGLKPDNFQNKILLIQNKDSEQGLF